MFDRVFQVEQQIDLPIDQVFAFFAKAETLEKITPSLLKFKVTTPTPIEMREGAIIDYKLKIRGLPVSWKTRIEEWNPPHRFVDRQLVGPYSLWYHTHEFTALSPTSTLMKDTVRYRVPLGPLGWMMDRLLVRPDIQKIFDFRRSEIGKYL